MTRMHMAAINGTANSVETKIQKDFPLCKAEKRNSHHCDQKAETEVET